jgi:Ca2+-binding RTX toxin-like protein
MRHRDITAAVVSAEPLEPRRLMAVSAPIFQPPVDAPAPLRNARVTAAGDFDGDGRTDIAYVTGSYKDVVQGGQTVRVFAGEMRFLAGDGKGKFKPVGVAVPLTQEPKSIVADDFNRDGRTDLVMSMGSNRAGVMLGLGKGLFAPVQQYASVDYDAGQTVRGDFNGDGLLDFAVSGQRITAVDPQTGKVKTTESEIAVHLGVGGGLFTGPIFTHIAGNYPLSIAAADWTGDGRTDLAVGGRTGVQLLAGKGDGTFNFPTQYGTDRAADVTTADFNGDGRPDFAWLRSGDDGVVEYVLSSGKGKFAAVRTLEVAGSAAVDSLAAGDFDGDGLIDLLAGPTAGGAGYFVNQGGGGFTPHTDAPGAKPGMTADFNRDGRTDVLSADGARIYLGAAQPLPPVYMTRRGTLVVTGTRRADTVRLLISGSRVQTTLNGVTFSSRLSRVKRIEVVTGLGDDSVAIDASVFSDCLVSAGGDDDTVGGGSGDDTLQGDNGDDVLFGGRGEDLIQGGRGDDTVAGGRGTDAVFGNAGRDTFSRDDAAGEHDDFTSEDLLD